MRVNISESHDKTLQKMMEDTDINSPTHMVNVIMTYLKIDKETMEALKDYARTRNQKQ
jgi:hypothetical protein